MAALVSLKKHSFALKPGAILVILWLIAAGVDRLWFSLDHNVPAWDQSDHLTRSIYYWRSLQHPQLFSLSWWTELWRLSPSYRAPFVYLMTAPFLTIFGRGYDQATLTHLGFTALLLASVYQLGRHLFTVSVGLWAAGILLCLPGLALLRTEFLLDYALVAVMAFTFTSLTLWRDAQSVRASWFLTLGTGLGLGLVLLTKPTGLLFLGVPLAWSVGEVLWQRQWQRLLQLIIMAGLAWLIFGPWFQTNWITILSSSDRSNQTSQLFNNMPPINTWAAWLYYWRSLPILLSYPLLLIPLGLLALGTGQRLLYPGKAAPSQAPIPIRNWQWLIGFLLGAYFFCSLIVNKDPRHFVPILPGIAVLLARWFTLWQTAWSAWVRWGAIAAAALLLAINLFPLPGAAQWGGKRLPYQGQPYPHDQVVAEIVQTNPYLRSTVAVLSDTAQLNAFNIDYYGTLANFQVYGRDAGFHREHVERDGRSLNWFLKLKAPGSPLGFLPGQADLKTLVEASPDIQLQRTWAFPTGDQLQLYRRRNLPVQVVASAPASSQVQLQSVTLPVQVPPGQPVPVTYQFAGTWEQLQSGLVLLTWQQSENPESFWLHDHGIGLGQLDPNSQLAAATASFQVTEQMAMVPPASTAPGTYRLKANYLNRQTGETYSLAVPPVQVVVAANAPAVLAPEPDLVTQLRQLAWNLPQGKLDKLFSEVGRINQYDPTQDYTLQAEQTLSYRLQQNPKKLDLAYNLALAYVLQRQVKGAIATLNQVTQLDPHNPYPWAYLGFVYLYNWQPQLADTALQQAAALNPQLPDLQILQAVAALMQLNLPKAWSLLHT